MLATPRQPKSPCRSVPVHRIPPNCATPVKDLLPLVDGGFAESICPRPACFGKRSIISTSGLPRWERSGLAIRSHGLLGTRQGSVESPAKIFARMKAKLATGGGVCAADAQPGPRCTLAKSVSHEMGILALSPSPSPPRTRRGSRRASSRSGITPHSRRVRREQWKEAVGTNGDEHGTPDVLPAVPRNKLLFLSPVGAELPRSSPAKIFAHMKEKVQLMQRHEGGNYVNGTLDASSDYVHEFPKQSPTVRSEDDGDCELSLDKDFTVDVPSTATSRSNAPSDVYASPVPEEPPVHVSPAPTSKKPVDQHLCKLMEDPLLQRTPRICIPKKRAAEFPSIIGSESSEKPEVAANIVHLREWQIKMLHNGFFVDGLRMDNNLPWHSNIIAQRVACNILKTVTGSTYVLVGNMVQDNSSTLPKWLLKKFLFGFPKKWKNYLETYLSQVKSSSSDPKKHGNNSTGSRMPQRQSKRTTKGHTLVSGTPKTHKNSASSAPRNQQSVPKVSRSGRLIKPPLEYWKGGRIVMDADMNMTIHEDYLSMSVLYSNKALSSPSPRKEKNMRSTRSCTAVKVLNQWPEERGQEKSDIDTKPHSNRKAAKADVEHLGWLSRQSSVPLSPLNTLMQLRKRCLENNLKFHPAKTNTTDGEMVDGPTMPSVSLSNVFFTDSMRNQSSSSDEKETGLQRRVKSCTQLSRRRQHKKESLQIPGPSRTQNASEVKQSAKRSKYSKGGETFRTVVHVSDSEQSTGTSQGSRICMMKNQTKSQACVFERATDKVQTDIHANDLVTGVEHPTSLLDSVLLEGNHVRGLAAKDAGHRRDMASSFTEEPPTVPKTSSQKKQRGARASTSKPLPVRSSKRSRRDNKDSETDSACSSGTRHIFYLRSQNRTRSQGNLTDTSDASQNLRWSNCLTEGCGSDPGSSEIVTSDQYDFVKPISRKQVPAQVHKDDQKQEDNSFQTASNTPGVLLNGHLKKSLPKGGKRWSAMASSDSSSPEDFQRSQKGKDVHVKGAAGSLVNTQPSEKKQEASRAGKGKNKENVRVTVSTEEEGDDNDAWTEKELDKLQKAVTALPKHKSGFWVNVSMMVGTRSAEECQEQFTQQQIVKVRSRSRKSTALTSTKETGKETLEITAKVGTLKRKQQMRQFLDHMAKDNHDDIFTGSPLQNKRVKLPTLSTNVEDDVFRHLEHNQTPSSSSFPPVKTPQCLHISPGMLGSINRNNNDWYVYKLQKKMRKGWANVQAPGSSQEHRFTPASSTKCVRRRNEENDSLVVWEMFSDKDPAPLPSDDSGEEDYYFSDND